MEVSEAGIIVGVGVIVGKTGVFGGKVGVIAGTVGTTGAFTCGIADALNCGGVFMAIKESPPVVGILGIGGIIGPETGAAGTIVFGF
ncbi:hypothetical protein HY967_01595 [Candidatus Jorgensenbacteria bacterium]|nr:hypothetical protein [Candidatus Jorgensenbacteria bacterium]